MVDCNKRLVEVNTILNLLSEEYYNKIPQDVIQAIQDNMDTNYIWEYDDTKELKDQDVSRDTIAMLSYINMEYLLNEKQKDYMENLHKINEQKQRQKEYSNENVYDYSDLFKRNNKAQAEANVVEEKQETALIEYKESIFKRFINKIKSFFGI